MALHSFISNFVNLLFMSFVLTTLLTADTQARIGYFWHITDLHLDTIYSTQGDPLRSCWRIERQPLSSSTRLPGRFGDYFCDSPWSLIESAAKAMKSRQGDNVEFVLWTGDGLSHSAHPMFESKKLEILRNITDLLGRTFSSQFVFPVLGHEDGTTTNFRHMGELWRHWLPSEALQTFEKGGYYSIEQTKSRLRIIALNTNFMRHDPKYSQSHLAAVRQRQPNGGIGSHPDSPEYKNFYYHHGNVHQHHGHSDWSSSSAAAAAAASSSSSAFGYGYNSHHRGIGSIPGTLQQDISGNGGRVSALSEFENQDTEKQWNWLEEVLSKSKNNKETVYIVGHIPPGSDERHIGIQQNGHTTFTESNNKRYLELVRKYSSIIQGQFFGHLHSDSFRIIYDDKGKPVSWIMISPSVTPRKTNVGSNNPAMRLYKFDTDSGQVLDYTQYYLDLQMANTLGEPNWQPEYNLTHYYGLNDISAISLHNFVDRFTSNDASWFAKYYRANTVRYQTDPCEGVCLLNHYCAITRIDYKEFRQCLDKERSALTSDASATLMPTPSLILSTSCPLLALLFTLAAACCRSTLKLMPKLLRQLQRNGEKTDNVHQSNKLLMEIATFLMKNPKKDLKCHCRRFLGNNNDKNFTTIGGASEGVTTFVSEKDKNCLQQSIAVQDLQIVSDCTMSCKKRNNDGNKTNLNTIALNTTAALASINSCHQQYSAEAAAPSNNKLNCNINIKNYGLLQEQLKQTATHDQKLLIPPALLSTNANFLLNCKQPVEATCSKTLHEIVLRQHVAESQAKLEH